MIADRYYYGRLSKEEQVVYKELYQGIKEIAPAIQMKALSQPDRSIPLIYQALFSDNPHFYYVDISSVRCQYNDSFLKVYPAYIYSKSQIENYNQLIQEKANEIIKTLIRNTDNNSEAGKERSLYEYFVQHYKYDEMAVKTTELYVLCRTHSILGVLLDEKAVCEGFAKAFKFLMNAMDLKCIVVSGKADWEYEPSHMWNIVKIEGQAYHVDVTWALTTSDQTYINYDYLNLSDNEIAFDHKDFSGVPKCSSKAMDTYRDEVIRIDNSIYLKNYLKDCIKKHKTHTIIQIVNGDGHCGFHNYDASLELLEQALKRVNEEGVGKVTVRSQVNEKKRLCKVKFEY